MTPVQLEEEDKERVYLDQVPSNLHQIEMKRREITRSSANLLVTLRARGQGQGCTQRRCPAPRDETSNYPFWVVGKKKQRHCVLMKKIQFHISR